MAEKANLQLQIPEVKKSLTFCRVIAKIRTLKCKLQKQKRLLVSVFSLFQGVTPENLSQKCPQLFNQLRNIDAELSGGCTAVVGLVFHNKLFVANVGMFRLFLSTIQTSFVQIKLRQCEAILLSLQHVLAILSCL